MIRYSTALGITLEIFQFDPLLQEWSQLSNGSGLSAPIVRINYGFTATRGRAYMFGGEVSFGNQSVFQICRLFQQLFDNIFSLSSSASSLNEFFSFDLETLSWSDLNANLVKGEPPLQRTSPGFTSMNDKLFIFGGMTGFLGI
jgi:hypothetical protein